MKHSLSNIICLMVCLQSALLFGAPKSTSFTPWQEQILAVPYERPSFDTKPVIQAIELGYGRIQPKRAVMGTPMKIGTRRFERGLGTHAVSDIRLFVPEGIKTFSAWVGVDAHAKAHNGSVVFTLTTDEKELYRSPVLRQGEEAQRVQVKAGGARILHLRVGDAGNGIGSDHANWADARVVTESGETLWLDSVAEAVLPPLFTRYPFSFVYDGQSSEKLLPQWQEERKQERLGSDRTKYTTTWTDPKIGLRLIWETLLYRDFPAVDTTLFFENSGSADTAIVQDIHTLDIAFPAAISSDLFRLHSIRGGVPNPTHFEPKLDFIEPDSELSLGTHSGRSSKVNTPFFKLEGKRRSLVVGIEWSGHWQALFDGHAHGPRIQSGMHTTHFRLHPGERVRMPRYVLLLWEGDTEESNAQFRQLIHKHYAARNNGQAPLPIPFCNTCFTRGGGWLNETTEENQISLIEAYAKLGLEALITDAGWYEGGYPLGEGNWTPRQDNYPNGMAPVAQAAKDNGMIYGLWFEPERVVIGTDLHREHPDWVLKAPGNTHTFLANFALPEIQNYFFDIVKDFMDLPGFSFYRQDFNVDPRAYWRAAEAEDRQGIVEIRYVEGIYAYWERILNTWPDAILEECASGGHRIDLGTVMRMHVHQKADHWFNYDADQGNLWAISQYLPNNCIVAHLRDLDDYSFHSTMASSLCFGWIADAPDFDSARGRELLQRYHKVKHLLVGAWYPLLPYPYDHHGAETDDEKYWIWREDRMRKFTRPKTTWTGSQFHRPDLDEGMLLYFRRPDSPYKTVQVNLRGLNPTTLYELIPELGGKAWRATGATLMQGLDLTLDNPRSSKVVVYRKVE